MHIVTYTRRGEVLCAKSVSLNLSSRQHVCPSPFFYLSVYLSSMSVYEWRYYYAVIDQRRGSMGMAMNSAYPPYKMQ